MNILIIGGSNSLIADGYVSHLYQSLQGHTDVTIKQISVGATTTLSAVGRLHDTFCHEQFDVILYEYSINDTGHFAWRAGGAESYLLTLYLLIKVAAKLYPSAMFVPLVLAQERHFPAATEHPFYDLQIAAFAQLSLPYIDIRKWMSELFLGKTPAWMYRDQAHYATPHATSIIGAVIAQRLLGLRAEGADRLNATCAKLMAQSPFSNVELVYVPALNLEQFATGRVEKGHSGNRLMHLDYLRMHPGSRLELHTEMFPLAIYLKSDASHDMVSLAISSPAGLSQSVHFGTRHADTDSYGFIYSSIPLPLLWGNTLLAPFGASAFALAVPEQHQAAGEAINFDCFGTGHPSAADHYLDLVSVLFVVAI